MNNHKKCCDYSYRFKNFRARHGLLFIGLCLAFFVFTVFEMFFIETSGSGTFVMISHAEGEATKTDSTQTDSTKKDSTNTKSRTTYAQYIHDHFRDEVSHYFEDRLNTCLKDARAERFLKTQVSNYL